MQPFVFQAPPTSPVNRKSSVLVFVPTLPLDLLRMPRTWEFRDLRARVRPRASLLDYGHHLVALGGAFEHEFAQLSSSLGFRRWKFLGGPAPHARPGYRDCGFAFSCSALYPPNTIAVLASGSGEASSTSYVIPRRQGPPPPFFIPGAPSPRSAPPRGLG